MRDAARALVERLEALGKTVVTAESCTAGLVSGLVAAVPGASKVFWGGFVTYSVEAKVKLLGVDRSLVDRFGAVSAETARAMAEGALERSGADCAVSVTGLAGPDGDGSQTPVGTVWVGVACRAGEAPRVGERRFHFSCPRNELRRKAAETALEALLEYLDLT